MRLACAFTLVLGLIPPLAFAVEKSTDGFVPMFNGKDLTGWVNVNCHPGTFFIKDDMVVTTGKPTGYLRTAKQYENFIADFEWMHLPEKPGAVGNSGFFVWADPIPATGTGYTRGIEVQVLVNLTYTDKKTGAVTASSHGDLFSIWGATCVPDRPHPNGSARCIPSENRAKGEGEWNHYRVEANNGVIKLQVNGKEVSGVSKCSPRKGYLALESEGSECRFRNLKIKELPSTHPKPEEIADEDKGFHNLYTGLDLANWEKDPGHKGHWQPSDWVLHYDGKSETEAKSLYVDKKLGDYEMIVDWKLPAKKGKENKPRFCGLLLRETDDYMLTLNIRSDGKLVLMESSGEQSKFLAEEMLTAHKPVGQWNRTIVTLKAGRLSATLNGKRILDNVKLEKPPRQGEFALMHNGHEIDFANIFVRDLK